MSQDDSHPLHYDVLVRLAKSESLVHGDLESTLREVLDGRDIARAGERSRHPHFLVVAVDRPVAGSARVIGNVSGLRRRPGHDRGRHDRDTGDGDCLRFAEPGHSPTIPASIPREKGRPREPPDV